NAGPAYIRKAAIRPDKREVKHVSAYSHSDRWIGASGAWGDAWVGAGEIPWSQGIRNFCCGTVFRNDRAVPGGSRNICRAAQGAGHERVGARRKCGQGGWYFLQDDPSGERATPSSHHRSSRGQRLRSHRYVIAWAQRTFHASNRQCDKQGADARENPRTGLSVTAQTARSNKRAGRWPRMTTIGRALSRAIVTINDNEILKQLALLCAAGLFVSLLMLTYGVDLSPG